MFPKATRLTSIVIKISSIQPVGSIQPRSNQFCYWIIHVCNPEWPVQTRPVLRKLRDSSNFTNPDWADNNETSKWHHRGDSFFFCVHSLVRVYKTRSGHWVPSKSVGFGWVILGHMHERSNNKISPIRPPNLGWTKPSFITLVIMG